MGLVEPMGPEDHVKILRLEALARAAFGLRQLDQGVG